MFHLLQVTRWPRIFVVTFVSPVSSSTKKKKISVSFVTWYGIKNIGISIEFAFVTFVSLVSGEKKAQNFFRYFCLACFFILQERKISVSFITWYGMKNIEFPLNLPLLHLFHLFRVKRWPRFVSRYFCFAYFFILQKKKIFVSSNTRYRMKNILTVSIESTFVTFISLVTGKKMAQIFFSLLLFHLFLHPPEKENLCFFCFMIWYEEYGHFH